MVVQLEGYGARAPYIGVVVTSLLCTPRPDQRSTRRVVVSDGDDAGMFEAARVCDVALLGRQRAYVKWRLLGRQRAHVMRHCWEAERVCDVGAIVG